MIPRVLAIAGSDSGGGAGIQADIKTITMLGGHAMTAVTALTAQNTLGVDRIMPVPADMVIAQIDAVVRDIGVDAVKIGMIGSAEVAEAVAERLRRADLAHVAVVFDPVMVASTGAILADAGTAFAFALLLTRATLVTPNLDELAALSGRPVRDEIETGYAAVHLIQDRGVSAVLVTGVPLAGGLIVDDTGNRASTDTLLFDLLFKAGPDRHETNWSDERIDTVHDHGTGCTLSSAIACGLGAGLTLEAAIERGRTYVRAALLAAPGIGQGHGPMGHGLERAYPDFRSG